MLLRMIVACGLLAVAPAASLAQDEGQSPGAAETANQGQEESLAQGALEAAIATQLTWQSHNIAANTSANFLEGAACPAATKMVSGACHPGYSDLVIIINQYPNIAGNTWRCGFRNNNPATRTVWIYTLCAQ
jgi:hypothetical protein